MSVSASPEESVPAIVVAGDGRAAKAVYGESKVYLEVGGRPLVANVVSVLQQVPEVSAVWVVGNSERLETVLRSDALKSELTKPLHIVPQFRSLYENGWETYRRLLPGASAEGRDPEGEERDLPVLYLSGDLPFATPQEISVFIRRALATEAGYVLGIVPAESLVDFRPSHPGGPGIVPALVNLREVRCRQSNLHLLRPGRIVNRVYIEGMYDHRYQKEWGHIARLAWQLFRSQQGGLVVVAYYVLMVMGGIAHRNRWSWLADRIRAWVPSRRIEIGVGALLGTEFRFTSTEAGGCAVDIDKEAELDASLARYDEWITAQRDRARRIYGDIPAPQSAAAWQEGTPESPGEEEE